jgi:uncharacterized protein (DUF2461 family)
MDDGRRAGAFERALRSARDAGLEIIEPELKRAPRGYPQDHPRIEHLRRKHLTVFRRHPLEPWLHEPAGTELVVRELDATRPLVSWIGKHVGPSQLEPRRR